jgi:transposase-like protein
MSEVPICPWCRNAKHVQASGENAKAFHCRGCHRSFEAEDDGDVTYGSPSKRIEREERHTQRRRR